MPNGYLEPFNSLNRVKIVKGRVYDAVELLSSDTIIHNSEGYERWSRDFILFLNTLLCSTKEERLYRPDWNEKHWDFWASRKVIVLGGGITAGPCGDILKRLLSQAKCAQDREFIFPKESATLPMLGAVLATPGVINGKILGLDYGHSGVKSALFTIKDREVITKEDFPVIRVNRNFSMTDTTDHYMDEKQLDNLFYGSLENQLQQAGREVDGVAISIANYIQDGVVVPRGMYGYLGKDLLLRVYKILDSHGISQKHFVIQHDGTAAANCFSNYDKCGVLIMGSAIGGGFPYKKLALCTKM